MPCRQTESRAFRSLSTLAGLYWMLRKSYMMKRTILVTFLAVTIQAPFSLAAPHGGASAAHELRYEGSRITVVKSDDVVENNPYYIDPLSEQESKKASRSKVETALSKARRKPGRRSGLQKKVRKISKTAKRHRAKIMFAVGLYAFRKEITSLCWKLVSHPVEDPVSGHVVRQIAFSVSPTAILKLAVFFSVMRQLQLNGEGSSPAALMLLTSGKGGNLILPLLLSSFFSPSNSAYLPSVQQHFTFERLNERYQKDGMALQKAMKAQHTIPKPHEPPSTILTRLLGRQVQTAYNGTIIMLDLTGLDSSLSQLDSLRDSVSFLLSENGITAIDDGITGSGAPSQPDETDSEHHAQCEIVVLLESPGGFPSEYALASQQIIRMRNHGLKVTICVDKVAASGGYMIACTASPGQLYAAPFSILGSIGVVGQVVNVHKTLKNWGVDPLIFRAGKDKAPISAIGEVTTEGVVAVQNIVDNTHRAFKRHVVASRPILEGSIERIATGDIWLGYDAFDHRLIDRIVTSDEYVSERLSEGARILKLVKMIPPRYPFFRPTTSRGVGTKFTASSNLRLLVLIRNALDQLSGFLGQFV